MKKRETILAIILGLAFLGGTVYAGWSFVASPYFEERNRVRTLQDEIAERQNTADTLELKNKRLQTEVYKRSLPADPEIAKQEYSTALRKILSDSKVPIGYGFVDRPPDKRNIPEIVKGKPYYNKIAYTITISKIDVGTLMTFLKKFYDMNLLHQITQFNIKREDTAKLAADTRPPEKRTDLNVTLAIEAIILDGVPARKTLFAAPTGTGALMGGMGLYSLENNLDNKGIARGITPQEIVRVLATPGRDYSGIVTQDVFHGYVPPPKPIVIGPPPGPPVVPPPIFVKKLPDLSRFVVFNNLIRTSDGNTRVEIFDQYANVYYSVDLFMSGEKLNVKTQKFAIESGVRVSIPEKSQPVDNWLDINNTASSGNRKFWVYGFDVDSLILGDREIPAAAAEAPKVPNKGGKQPAPKGTAAPKGTTTPPKATGGNPFDRGAAPPAATDPKAALMGGIVTLGAQAPAPAAPTERFYRWTYGHSMKEKDPNSPKEKEPSSLKDRYLVELTKAEAETIIRRIQGVSPALSSNGEKEKAPMPVTVPNPMAVVGTEVAPQPREVTPAPVVDPGK